MVPLLVFYNSYFGDSFFAEKLLDAKSPFGDSVFKNPARYILVRTKTETTKKKTFSDRLGFY